MFSLNLASTVFEIGAKAEVLTANFYNGMPLGENRNVEVLFLKEYIFAYNHCPVPPCGSPLLSGRGVRAKLFSFCHFCSLCLHRVTNSSFFKRVSSDTFVGYTIQFRWTGFWMASDYYFFLLAGMLFGFRALYYPELIPSVVFLLSRPHIID